MLVLSRKLTERIVIGDDIIVTVLGIRAGKIRIGIEAPAEMRVLRHELQDRLPEASGEFATPPVVLVES